MSDVNSNRRKWGRLVKAAPPLVSRPVTGPGVSASASR